MHASMCGAEDGSIERTRLELEEAGKCGEDWKRAREEMRRSTVVKHGIGMRYFSTPPHTSLLTSPRSPQSP